MFEDHLIFSQNPQAIQIVAYFDEMETANALGPRASKNNKLGLIILFKYDYTCKQLILLICRCCVLHDCKFRAAHEVKTGCNSFSHPFRMPTLGTLQHR